jgi:hypothetical protein
VSVTFRVKGLGDVLGVEMGNSTAQIVLRMLGLESEGYLEGRTTVVRLKRELTSIDDTTIALNAVQPRQLGLGWVDAGTSEAWLRSRIEGLRGLVEAAERSGALQIVWD